MAAPNRRRAAALFFVIGIAGLVLSMIHGFVLVPLYLTSVSVDTYGAWLASAGALMMITMIDPGIGSVATQRLSRLYGENSMREFAADVGTMLVVGAVLGIFVVILALPIVLFAPTWFGCPNPGKGAMSIGLMLLAIATGLTTFQHCIGSISTSLQKPAVPGLAVLFSQIVGLVATVVALKWGIGIVAIGFGRLTYASVVILFYLIHTPLIWKSHGLVPPTFSFPTFVKYFRTSSYLVVSKLTSVAGAQLDAPVAAISVSAEASVVLNQTSKFAELVPMFMARLGAATYAGVGMESGRNTERITSIFLEIFQISATLSTCLLCHTILFTEPLIRLWIKKDLYGGATLLIMTAVVAFLRVLNQTLASDVMALGFIPQVARAQMFEAPFRIISLLILAPLFGLVGIVLSSLCSLLLTTIPICRVYLRESHIGVRDLGRIMLPCVAINCLVWWIFSTSVASPNSWAELGFQATGLALVQSMAFFILFKNLRSSILANVRAVLRGVSCIR